MNDLLDQGYSDSHDLIQAHEEYGIEMIMPMRTDHAWQSQIPNGYDLCRFQIDWKAQQDHCPQGKTSASWRGGHDKQGHPCIEVMFNTSDCAPCPARMLCTRSKRQRRKLTLRPQSEHELIQAARTYQQTQEFKDRYAVRAGVEGTVSQAASALDMRRSRYCGHSKLICSMWLLPWPSISNERLTG